MKTHLIIRPFLNIQALMPIFFKRDPFHMLIFCVNENVMKWGVVVEHNTLQDQDTNPLLCHCRDHHCCYTAILSMRSS